MEMRPWNRLYRLNKSRTKKDKIPLAYKKDDTR